MVVAPCGGGQAQAHTLQEGAGQLQGEVPLAAAAAASAGEGALGASADGRRGQVGGGCIGEL